MTGFVALYMSKMRGKKISILDIGSRNNVDSKSDSRTYKELFSDENWNYVGMDICPGDNVDIVVTDMYHWNIESESYDVVISGQTFEHIEYFWLTMQEIYRVLKPMGLVCIIAPSTGNEHRHPKDCWRFYADGLKAMATYAKLEIIEAVITHDDSTWNDAVLIAKKK